MTFLQVRRTLSRVGILSVAVLALVIVGLMGKAVADNGTANREQRMVTIYDRGVEQTIITRARTVAEALAQAHIPVEAVDLVEPALSEELTADRYNINVYRARPVIVVDGHARVRAVTAAQSPAKIAEAARVTLYPEDDTDLKRVDNVVDEGGAGLKLTIDRATPFTFVLYGKRLDTARTQATTVGDMLKEKGVTLGKDDGTSLPVSTPIVAGMTIAVWRNGVQTITQEEDVNMPVRKIQNVDQPVGFRQVQTPGKPGKKQVTYEMNLQNGTEISRKEIQSVVTTQPIEQVEVVGAKPVFTGDFAAALAKLRQCESGGNYANKNNPKYRGAYQYDYSTWANYQGIYDPADAPPAVQDQKAWETYQRRGWQPWPSCGASLPDTYR